MFLSVNIYSLDFNNEVEASRLKKEMEFSFKGICDGVMGSVILKDCEAVNID